MDKRERFNGISHLIGTCLALAGLVVLVISAASQGDPRRTESFSIHGVSLLTLYSFSALYRIISDKAKAVFEKLDHSAIYLLIAGTCMPSTPVTLRGAWGLSSASSGD